jgi:hypothetical protein
MHVCLLAALCLTGLPLQAEELGHAEVGSRSITLQERVERAEQLECEEELEDEEAIAEASDEGIAATSEEGTVATSEEDVVMGAYYSDYPRIFEGSHHWPAGRSTNGDTIKLEDGTMWSIRKADAKLASDWRTDDRVIVRPNSSRLSIYAYELVNLDTGDILEASLAVGPLVDGAYSLRIADIDLYRNRILIRDGAGRTTTLSTSSFDREVIEGWQRGDYVVFGVNNDWSALWNHYAVINVSTLDYARGSLRNY